MKIFLSWSGDLSHKVAIVFRDWMPSVIQSITPYVSSEDIDKGARWSTDIAKELEDSTFGVLCVTRENIGAPWLNFEAGALSKTMDKPFVSPFLFDVKRSEVDGPILQFQSTIFEKDDIYKLIKTINKACAADCLTDDRLEKAFTVWYPSLEENLNKLTAENKRPDATVSQDDVGEDDKILEEILELSRMNQKLLRNPDGVAAKEIVAIKEQLNDLVGSIEMLKRRAPRKFRRFHPGILEELLHLSKRFDNSTLGLQIILGLYRDDFPWIYDAGVEVIRVLKSKRSREEKNDTIKSFLDLVEFSLEHPLMREISMPDKESYMLMRELPFVFRHLFSELA